MIPSPRIITETALKHLWRPSRPAWAAPFDYLLAYVYGPTGVCVIDYMAPGQSGITSCSILKDYLGSLRLVYAPFLTTPLYYNYSPFGELLSSNSSTGAGSGYNPTNPATLFKYLYTGQEWDPEISLYNYHARQYDPTLGRFLSPDPLFQTPSPYTYCADNPINFVDPTGESIWDWLENTFEWLENSYGLFGFLTRSLRDFTRAIGQEALWQRWLDWRLQNLQTFFRTENLPFSFDWNALTRFRVAPLFDPQYDPRWDPIRDRILNAGLARGMNRLDIQANHIFDRHTGGLVGIWNTQTGRVSMGYYTENRSTVDRDAALVDPEGRLEERALLPSHNQLARQVYGLRDPFYLGLRMTEADEPRGIFPELRGFRVLRTGPQSLSVSFGSQSLNGYSAPTPNNPNPAEGEAWLESSSERMGIALALRNQRIGGQRLSVSLEGGSEGLTAAERASAFLLRL